ncbi:putative cyclin-dependent kinase inhibitor domain-containing protein [Helianthus annuus]|nr:putative cyclin-dependent kinase inhibitor [Helianthus annuus]KAJ0530471.1 putative cyclin-dependent kinase inhibitor domain-containing protein [Helianthus annuus]KAJ0700721.1 putative cyclin-dependent kinase inhibitor domain-containing protein [Helianthus annuus]KAJ0884325.1 putative cyclin-dependent kinase inhibitor [Helianthus annuus]
MNTNRCKTIDEISLMKGPNSLAGVRRSRDTDVTSSGSTKRTKFDHDDHDNVVLQLENHCQSKIDMNLTEKDVSSTDSGDHVVSSTCFEDNLSLDLKTESRFKTETSMSSNDGFSRETSSSSEICLDSDEMESSSKLKSNPSPPLPLSPAATSCRKPPTAENNPTPAEIDEFFSVFEKKEQKRFADKYNYDIVNDVPMEGRYQWVVLKP